MAERQGELDPHKAVAIAVLGKKGTGKTELAYHLFSTYPYDRVLIDPNGDIVREPEWEELERPVPARWPGWGGGTGEPKRRTFVYVPDFADPAHAEELDRVYALALVHPRTLVMTDEAHEGFPANGMDKRPHARRLLRHHRHGPASHIEATPRALTVDPLVISQADWVYCFKLPNRADRKRVAENIGWDPKEFDEAIFGLGPHEYLRYDASSDELAHFPALPAHLIKHHAPH